MYGIEWRVEIEIAVNNVDKEYVGIFYPIAFFLLWKIVKL